jgi:hypothetical protein
MAQPTANRVNIIGLIAGTRGTGKTTFIKGSEELKVNGLIDGFLDRDPKQKILIVDLFDNPIWRDVQLIDDDKLKRWKSGLYRIYDNNESVLMKKLNHYCYNTIIIFEDATKYIKNTVEENLRRLLIDSKQKNNDVFFAFHYLMAIPPDLTRISDYLVLFKTNESFSSALRNKYPHPDIQKAFKEVSEHKDFHYYKSIALI